MAGLLRKLVTKLPANTHSQSFFHNEPASADSSCFWSKEPIESKPSKANFMASYTFYIRSKKKHNEFKTVYITLHNTYLIMSKVKDWTKNCKSVDLRKTLPAVHRLTNIPSKFAQGLLLVDHDKEFELFSKNTDDLRGLLNQLKKYVVQHNFEDHYIVDKKLGSGSYADVFLIKHKHTNQEFAAKFFDISAFKDANRSRKALRNEIRIHAQLEHRSIIRFYELYENSTHIIFVLEYAKGERLIDYVMANAPISEREGMLIIKEILQALQYLHTQNIIHRDLKLENIMIYQKDYNSYEYTIKIVDYGLSVKTDNIDLFKKSGTPGYVAPEVFTSETYDTKADMFSTGVILFTMLSGRSPFVGMDRNAVLKANRKCDYTFKPRHWQNRTSTCRDLVRKLMEAKPEERFSAEEALKFRWFSVMNFPKITQSGTIDEIFFGDKSQNREITSSVKNKENIIVKRASVNRPVLTENDNLINKTCYNPNSQTSVKNPFYRSNSEQNKAASTVHSINQNNSNLLQIPMMNCHFASSEESKSDLSPLDHEGINQASLQTFYRLKSDLNTFNSIDPGNGTFTPRSPASSQKDNFFTKARSSLLPNKSSETQLAVLSPGSGITVDRVLKVPMIKSRSFEPPACDSNNNSPRNASGEVSEDAIEEMAYEVPNILFKVSMNYLKKKKSLMIRTDC